MTYSSCYLLVLEEFINYLSYFDKESKTDNLLNDNLNIVNS